MGKKEAAEYCIDNQDVLKEKARNKYRNLSEEEKEAKRNTAKICTNGWKQINFCIV